MASVEFTEVYNVKEEGWLTIHILKGPEITCRKNVFSSSFHNLEGGVPIIENLDSTTNLLQSSA